MVAEDWKKKKPERPDLSSKQLGVFATLENGSCRYTQLTANGGFYRGLNMQADDVVWCSGFPPLPPKKKRHEMLFFFFVSTFKPSCNITGPEMLGVFTKKKKIPAGQVSNAFQRYLGGNQKFAKIRRR